MRLFFILLATIALSTNLAYAQYSVVANKNDSTQINTKSKNPFWKRTIAPAILFSLSAASWQADAEVRSIRNRYTPNFRSKLDDYMQYAPGATAFALKLSGIRGRNKLGRSAISWGGGMIIMGGLVNSIKYSAKVMRPDGSTRNSFPSGHTATAFMNATFLHKEYGHVNPLYSVLGYSMSTYTGVSRSLNNRHWLSDILAGAGIGILSTELSYLIVDSFYKNKGDFFSDFDTKIEIENPSFVSIKIGQSLYIDSQSIGKLGLDGAIEGAYFFNRRWGIGGEIGFMHMPFGQSSIEDWEDLAELSEIIDNPYIDVQSLGMSTFMIGSYYSKFIGSKFIFQAKALTGIGFGIGGDIDIKGDKKNTEILTEIEIPFMEYDISNTWIVGGGTSITGMIAPTMGLSLYVDYKYANPNLKIKLSSDYTNVKPDEKILDKSRMSINALSVGLKLTSFF